MKLKVYLEEANNSNTLEELAEIKNKAILDDDIQIKDFIQIDGLIQKIKEKLNLARYISR